MKNSEVFWASSLTLFSNHQCRISATVIALCVLGDALSRGVSNISLVFCVSLGLFVFVLEYCTPEVYTITDVLVVNKQGLLGLGTNHNRKSLQPSYPHWRWFKTTDQ